MHVCDTPLPPISDEECEALDVLTEEADPATTRRQQGLHASARAVRRARTAAERAAVERLRARLRRLRTELLSQLAGGTAFRRQRIADLVAAIDRAIADTHADLALGVRLDARTAAELGDAHVLDALRGAALTPVSTGVDATLVSAAYENTVDLLSAPMQQFRGRIVRQVRRLALGVEDFATVWQTLAADLTGPAISNAEWQTERIVRTELSRTFQTASYERAVQQAQRWPFLRKYWTAVGDSRTRDDHLIATKTYRRDKGAILVAERFSVGQARLRYPVDPLAEPPGRESAKQTILCRCSAGITIRPTDLRQATAQRVRLALSGR